MVHVELETHDTKDGTHNVGRSSLEDQQHYSIATGKHKRTIKPPIKDDLENLVPYALITSSGDPTTVQEAIHN